MAWLSSGNNLTDIGTDPLGTLDLTECDFHLLVEDKLTGIFTSLTGGDMEISVIKHDIVFETGSSTTLFIPGPISFSPINLSRGFGNYRELFSWLSESVNGDIIRARRSGSIVMVRQGDHILRWNFYNAWLSKLSSFALTQKEGSTVKIARLAATIVAETIEYDAV
jgi:phage tail-like protein